MDKSLSSKDYLVQIFLISLIGSFIVKYGELFFEFPFSENYMSETALALIFVPTALNG